MVETTEVTGVEVTVEVAKIESENEALVNRISDIAVTDQESYNVANGMLKEVKFRINTIKDDLEPRKKKAHEAYKEWISLIAKLIDPLLLIGTILKKKLGVYLEEQEEKRKEEEQKLIQKAEDEKLKQAEILKKHNMDREADDLMAARPKVEAVQSTVRSGGTYIAKSWIAVVESKKELARSVADGKVNTNAIDVNYAYLNRVARESKGKAIIPGVSFEEKSGVRTR